MNVHIHIASIIQLDTKNKNKQETKESEKSMIQQLHAHAIKISSRRCFFDHFALPVGYPPTRVITGGC